MGSIASLGKAVYLAVRLLDGHNVWPQASGRGILRNLAAATVIEKHAAPRYQSDTRGAWFDSARKAGCRPQSR